MFSMTSKSNDKSTKCLVPRWDLAYFQRLRWYYKTAQRGIIQLFLDRLKKLMSKTFLNSIPIDKISDIWFFARTKSQVRIACIYSGLRYHIKYPPISIAPILYFPSFQQREYSKSIHVCITSTHYATSKIKLQFYDMISVYNMDFFGFRHVLTTVCFIHNISPVDQLWLPSKTRPSAVLAGYC